MPSLRFGVVAVVFALAACGGSSSSVDAGDSAPLSCADLATALHARALAADNSCTTPADCAAVGYPVRNDSTPTCDCGVTFSSTCGGDAVNVAAWEGDSTTAAMLADWHTRCVAQGTASGAPTLCDCTTNGVTCSAAGQCVAREFNCLAPFDAGVQ